MSVPCCLFWCPDQSLLPLLWPLWWCHAHSMSLNCCQHITRSYPNHNPLKQCHRSFPSPASEQLTLFLSSDQLSLQRHHRSTPTTTFTNSTVSTPHSSTPAVHSPTSPPPTLVCAFPTTHHLWGPSSRGRCIWLRWPTGLARHTRTTSMRRS